MNPGTRAILFSAHQRTFQRDYFRVATFGDSTANTAGFGPANYLDQSTGDHELNGATQAFAQSTSKWLLSRYYPAAQVQYNGGIPGDTTTMMLARSSAGAGPTRRSIEDVLTFTPDLIIARCGSINDIATFTTATTQATVDAVFTRHMQILSGLTGSGAYIIDEGIAGFDASAGVAPAAPDLAFVRATLTALNARWAVAVPQLGKRVRFLSPVGLTCDASGAYLSNVTASSDGTHLTLYGQSLLAQAETALLTSWLGTSGPTPFPGANLMATQAAYPSPSTVAFGTVPNTAYFAWGAISGTRQNAVISTINGVPYAVCELVGTAASPQLSFNASLVPLLVTPGYVAADDMVAIEADFIAEAVTGTLAPSGVTATVQFGVDGTNRVVYQLSQNLVTASGIETSITGRIAMGRLRIPAAVATLASASTVFTIFANGVNGSTCRLKVGNIRVVKQ